MKQLKELVRPNIWRLAPYSSARNEYSGHEAHVFLDANENPYGAPLNRYPDPLQTELKAKLSKIKGIAPSQIFLGNGSDEAIDLCYRVFCEPKADNVVAIEPTYGMYKVCADINDVAYRPVLLDEGYQLNADKLLAQCDAHTKLIWICSPNTFREDLSHYPNLIVLNTFSKAWASAAIRLGMAFAQEPIIELFNKVKYPYNVNYLTQKRAIEVLDKRDEIDTWIKILLRERGQLISAFSELPICKQVFHTDANFFLARMTDAQVIYDYLVERGIIVRNRTRIRLCKDCLRVTIGSREENRELLGALRQYK